MKTLLRGSVAAGAILVFASSLAGAARAADVMDPEPYYSWSGLYVGAYAGPGAFLNKGDQDFTPFTINTDEGDDGFV